MYFKLRPQCHDHDISISGVKLVKVCSGKAWSGIRNGTSRETWNLTHSSSLNDSDIWSRMDKKWINTYVERKVTCRRDCQRQCHNINGFEWWMMSMNFERWGLEGFATSPRVASYGDALQGEPVRWLNSKRTPFQVKVIGLLLGEFIYVMFRRMLGSDHYSG